METAKAAAEAEATAKRMADALSFSMGDLGRATIAAAEDTQDMAKALLGATAGQDDYLKKLSQSRDMVLFAMSTMAKDYEASVQRMVKAGFDLGDASMIAGITIKEKFIARLQEMASTSEEGRAILAQLEAGIIGVAAAYEGLAKSQQKVIESNAEIIAFQMNQDIRRANWYQIAQNLPAKVYPATGFTPEQNALLDAIREQLNAARVAGNLDLVGRLQDDLAAYIAGFSRQKVPAMAMGGIVTRPTLAMVGERGPEAIVPLGRNGTGIGGITININGDIYGLDDLNRKVAAAVRKTLQGGGFGGLQFGST